MKKTKIICTMGPNSDNRQVMVDLALNGMDIARFNFSHGDHEEQKARLEQLKSVRDELDLPIAALLDTKGPEIRTGLLKDGKKVVLTEGQEFILTTRKVEGDETIGHINYAGLPQDVSEGSSIKVIAKIENAEGIDNIDSIIQASDGIMVARGDMGVEIPAERVPYIQKEIIRKCNEASKPVITATQMLDSMIRNPRPTRAEVTDVANAVYDGTDAVMLSGETAMGKYPVEALKMMAQIAEETEKHLDYSAYRQRSVSAENLRKISNAVCFSSVSTAHDLDAKAIVAPSISGFTAGLLSKYRPGVRIIGMSPSAVAVRQMQIMWGVTPFIAKRAESTDILIASSVDLLRQKGILESGDVVVVTAGVVSHERRHEPAQDTNIMRVVNIL